MEPPQNPGRINPAGVGLLGAAGPPRSDLLLGLVPDPAQVVYVPLEQRHGGVGGAGVQVGLDLCQRPVVGEPASAEVLIDQRPLPWGGRLHLKAPAARHPALRDLEPLAPAHQPTSTPVDLNCPGIDGGLDGWGYATSLDCWCSR